MAEEPQRVRIDKWLWAARFVKTRSLATELVKAGRVRVGGVGGSRLKPSREIRVGDTVEITLGEVRRTVVVRGLAERRGPAVAAALLYEETPESVAELPLSRSGRLGYAVRLVARHPDLPGAIAPVPVAWE